MTSLKSTIIELAETFIVSFVVIFTIYTLISSVEVVWGASMEPNFHTGERILVDKISPIFDSYKRGDVVVFLPPNDESKHYVKRVIGLPGDLIKVLNCQIYLGKDGKKFVLEEGYLDKETCTSGASAIQEGRSIRIPEDQYMLLGDNRNESIDSRYIGLVQKRKILGRVIFRFWPPSKFGFIE